MRRNLMTSRSAAARTAAALALPLALGFGPAHPAHAHAARRVGSSAVLHRVSIPDGSGTLALPSGWRITDSGQGLVVAAGPEGAVSFGFHVPMLTPAGARYLASMGIRPSLSVACSNDPGQVAVQEGRLWGARNLHLLKETRVSSGMGPAAFVMTQGEMPGKGELRALCYVLLIPRGDGGGIEYYASLVAAPTARFARSLPVLIQIWQSWKTDDRVFQQRLAQAAASMRQASETRSGVYNNRVAAQERANRAHALRIRGNEEVEDTQTGRRREVSAEGLRPRIDAANRHAGYQRYHPVPFHDLNR